ncbi:MAG: hypothetical protein RMJ15_02225 [Nitrososphaerota archaeon]|nr:hypothetical protein [Nitrososphaerota archaeon]
MQGAPCSWFLLRGRTCKLWMMLCVLWLGALALQKQFTWEDCGGAFKTQPQTGKLLLNLTDGQTFSSLVFNGSVGKALYALEPSAESFEGRYVRGDGRAIINQTVHTMAQLYFSRGEKAQQLVLCYRPMVTVASLGTSNGKPLNLIRIYIISLNASQPITSGGGFHLKVSSVNVTSSAWRHEFNSQVFSLALEAALEETKNVVWLPITSSEDGAIVSLEVLVCNIEIRRVNS